MTPVEDLLAQATTIKNETVENNNSATRVGAWMEEVIPHLEQIANKAESGGSEKTLKAVDDEINQLQSSVSDEINQLQRSVYEYNQIDLPFDILIGYWQTSNGAFMPDDVTGRNTRSTSKIAVSPGDIIITNNIGEETGKIPIVCWNENGVFKYTNLVDITPEYTVVTIPEGVYFISTNLYLDNPRDLTGEYIKKLGDEIIGDKIKNNSENIEQLLITFDSKISESIKVIERNNNISVNLSDFIDTSKTHSDCIDDCLNFVSMFENKTINFDVSQLNIDRAILLDSGTTINLIDCKIKQNNYVFDNVFRGSNVILNEEDLYYLPSQIDIISKIKINGYGESSIEGCDVNLRMIHPVTEVEYEVVGDWFGVRTHQINFAMANDIEISGIKFTKTRGWCISFDVCENLYLHDLEIISNVKNGDGIDLRSGCKHVKIFRCTGLTKDDFIACAAGAIPSKGPFPTSTFIYSSRTTLNIDADLVAAEPTALWVEDIEVKDCSAGSNYHGMICLSAYGYMVKNILVDNFHELQKGAANAFIYIYFGYGSGYIDGDLRDMRFNNISSNSAQYVVASNVKCQNIWLNKLENIKTPSQIANLSYADGFIITNS